jgi:hypothetical protein
MTGKQKGRHDDQQNTLEGLIDAGKGGAEGHGILWEIKKLPESHTVARQLQLFRTRFQFQSIEK